MTTFNGKPSNQPQTSTPQDFFWLRPCIRRGCTRIPDNLASSQKAMKAIILSVLLVDGKMASQHRLQQFACKDNFT